VPAGEANARRIMKSIAVIIGIVVIAVLLVSSGTVSGAFCVNGVGCLYSSGSGISVDNRESVTVSTGNP
jgi:hypothetical protein